MPTSSGRRLPLRVLQLEQAVKTLFQAFVPPRERGTRWSRVRHARLRSSGGGGPQNWQRYLSRANRNVLVTWRRKRRGTCTKRTSRMTAGRGTAIRSEWTGVPSASTTSALPSMTSRSARRTGTMVSGSKEAFRARQRMRYANTGQQVAARDALTHSLRAETTAVARQSAPRPTRARHLQAWHGFRRFAPRFRAGQEQVPTQDGSRPRSWPGLCRV